jgi:hypothetical protein
VTGRLDNPEESMSRAFVREDEGGTGPRRRYDLPARDDPGFEAAAANALLEGARIGDTAGAEEATGHRWGDPSLRPWVERILERAREERDDRLEQVAERYLE